MSGHKQALLKKHRRAKRVAMLFILTALVAAGLFIAWWWVPILLVVCWVAHEAWFSDHLFYSPASDYLYTFPADADVRPVSLVNGTLRLDSSVDAGQTLVLELELRSTWLGRWVDPYVSIGDDRQEFERGARGKRYLNLSGQHAALMANGLRLEGHHCRVSTPTKLYVLSHPDYADKRVMVLAPHADDAELAAFGLYSKAVDPTIVTLTQGEIEAENYQRLGLNLAEAARLKGRLRTWDSLAVPLWGGVAQDRCVQLGYYCLQLPAMREAPTQSFGSRESQESDIRTARRHNPFALPGDADGKPCWDNLVADLVALLQRFEPEVIVMPHPELDPHADHVATTQALYQAVAQSTWKPSVALLYANHLHDNDRWPMGRAGSGVALPPFVYQTSSDSLWSPSLDASTQMDKAMALAMQHDLQGRPPFKRLVRRWIQRVLVGRQWPATGEDEFFRKAVRRHEVFMVRPFAD